SRGPGSCVANGKRRASWPPFGPLQAFGLWSQRGRTHPFFRAPSPIAIRISRNSAKFSSASALLSQVKKPKPNAAKAARPATLAAAVPGIGLPDLCRCLCFGASIVSVFPDEFRATCCVDGLLIFRSDARPGGVRDQD